MRLVRPDMRHEKTSAHGKVQHALANCQMRFRDTNLDCVREAVHPVWESLGRQVRRQTENRCGLVERNAAVAVVELEVAELAVT